MIMLLYMLFLSNILNITDKKQNFDLSSYENKKINAAGVLLYAINPEDDRIYVLLSKEAKWEGASSEKWKGFGGKKEPKETLIQTALRETKEESRGVVQLNISNIDLNHCIICEHYGCRYLQVMIRIPFDSSLPEKFQKMKNCKQEQLEKTEIRWILFRDLIEMIKQVDSLSKKKKCHPRMLMDEIVLNDGIETLTFAKDFLETMVIIYRETSFDQLIDKKEFSCFPIVVSDKAYVSEY